MDDLLTGDIRPVRRAPPPPKSRPMGPQPRNDDLLVIQTEGEERPRPVPRASRIQSHRTSQNGLPRSASLPLTNSMMKKAPPPRPPPPKFNLLQKGHHQLENNGSSKSSSSGVGGMFGRFRGPPPSRPRPSPAHSTMSAPCTPLYEASLIDFSSPPGSPTTRSGSDGLSVNSFGSESSTGNQSLGFDDIFDPFGSIQEPSAFVPPRKVGGSSFFSSAPAACTVSVTNENQDPFDMLARRADMNSVQLHKSKNPVPIQNSSLSSSISSSITQPASQVNSNKQEQKNFRPTIIRPKAPVSSSLVESAGDSSISMNNHYLELGSVDWSVATKSSSTNVVKSSSGWDTGTTIIGQTIPEEPPPLPPRPEAEDEDEDRPHSIAEFDFVANHSGDLDFKIGDVIQLLYRINDEWLFGRCGLREGMFPQAFVKIVEPLAGEQPPAELSSQSTSTSTSVINAGSSIQSGISIASSGSSIQSGVSNTSSCSSIQSGVSNTSSCSSQVVTAAYTFHAEAPEDLTIHEGSKVHVMGRLNDQWLYGQCNGKYGQFPGNFVDRIPSNLPQM